MKSILKFRFKQSLIAAGLLCLYTVTSGFAQSEGDVTVRIENNQSLRSLAKQYLGEPNDWELILLYNSIQSPEELQQGQQLMIPVKSYQEFTRLLTECQNSILKANQEGAGVLAPDEIESAVNLLNVSIDLKKQADLKSAILSIGRSIDAATRAYTKTREKRIQAVTAILADLRGTVQYRNNNRLKWEEAAVKQDVKEKDHLRTLSRSYANVRFIDGSLVQMDENALIVVEAVKKDVLKNTSSADVLVLEGDVSAFIKSINMKDNFTVSLPGIETDIRSQNFMTSRDKKETTRIANYDGEIDVVSSGKKITLAENEGTKVLKDAAPAEPKKLLNPPVLSYPLEGESIYEYSFNFTWNPAGNAGGYQIQISRNVLFTEIVKNMRMGAVLTVPWTAPQNGNYFWRIRAIDDDQLSGPYSKPARFSILVDRTPPFLLLTCPVEDTVVFNDEIQFRGRTEDSGCLTINGDTVQVGKDGEFYHAVTVRPGPNQVTVAMRDKKGNESLVYRNITRSQPETLVYLDHPDTIIANNRRVAISGRTEPLVELVIDGRKVQTQNQVFLQYLDLREGVNSVILKASNPDGETQKKQINITVDTVPPELMIANIPNFTEKPSINIAGSITEPADLTINGKTVKTVQNTFEKEIDLAEGENIFRIKAVDRAGNPREQVIMINRDDQPPRILSHRFSKDAVTPGEIITLVVSAEDDGVGMARTGTFVAEVIPGKDEIHGMLKLNTQSGKYQGNFQVPASSAGKVRLKKLYISDYLGNMNEL